MKPNRDKLKVIIEPLKFRVTTRAVAHAYANSPGGAILESSRAIGPFARYSIFVKDPVGEVCFRDDVDSFESFINNLAQQLSHVGDVAEKTYSVPFVGGWIGYVGYDAATTASRGTCTNSLPLAHFRLYDTAAIYDHHTNTWYGVFVDWPDSTIANRSSIQSRISRLSQRLARIENEDNEPEKNACEPASSINNDWSRDNYLSAVERVLKYIADGDAYQINLAQRFSIETSLTPGDLYMRLRDCNPSSHAAFLTTKNAAIISSSPELFLNLRNGHVVTRPIKGTRPRGDNEWSDQTNRDELESSEKDHAELAMIVDLMRNDLGRVCEFGSVRVIDPGAIEALPTVFHRTATIEGRLRENQNWSDLFLATFPGGSITGAPKIRAMQIIDELEPAPRGVYCGSIGYIGLDGSMQMNIAIRTMIQVGRTVHIHAGSGIVADSEPEAEHAEILAKARAMFEAVGCEAPQPALCTGVAT